MLYPCSSRPKGDEVFVLPFPVARPVVADFGGPLADRVEGLHGADQFAGRKDLDVEAAAGGELHGVGEVLGDVIEKQPLTPGHDHLPVELLVRGLDGMQLPLDLFMTLVDTELLALGREGLGDNRQRQRDGQDEH